MQTPQECGGRPHVPAGRPPKRTALGFGAGFPPDPSLGARLLGPPAARSCSPRASLLVFGCGAWALGTRSAGDGSAPAGQDRQPLRPGLRPHCCWSITLVMGRGVEGNPDVAASPGPATGQAGGRVCRAQLRSAPACSGAFLSRDEASPRKPGFLLLVKGAGPGGGPRPPLTLISCSQAAGGGCARGGSSQCPRRQTPR